MLVFFPFYGFTEKKKKAMLLINFNRNKRRFITQSTNNLTKNTMQVGQR